MVKNKIKILDFNSFANMCTASDLNGSNEDGKLFNGLQHISLSFIQPTFAKVLSGLGATR